MESDFHLLQFSEIKVMIMVLLLIGDLRIINTVGAKKQALERFINHIVPCPWWNSPNTDPEKAFIFILKRLIPREYKAERQ